MFQNFDDIGGPAHSAERLRLLRQALEAVQLTGFLLPRSDEFQNEYVAPDAEQLLWLTGFSGSWGTAAVLRDAAALFIDGRYTLQAAAQVDGAAYEIINIADTSITSWLEAHLKPGDRLGYDPRLHTIAQIGGLTASVEKAGAQLLAVDTNPLVTLWTDRPVQAPKPVALQPLELAGVEARDKIGAIQQQLAKTRRDAVVITALELDRMAVQHPRPGPAAHSVRPRLCNRAGRGQGAALHRRAQADARRAGRAWRRGRDRRP